MTIYVPPSSYNTEQYNASQVKLIDTQSSL